MRRPAEITPCSRMAERRLCLCAFIPSDPPFLAPALNLHLLFAVICEGLYYSILSLFIKYKTTHNLPLLAMLLMYTLMNAGWPGRRAVTAPGTVRTPW